MDKVLLIEDDPHISELVGIHLKDLGLEVETAVDGARGIPKSKHRNLQSNYFGHYVARN